MNHQRRFVLSALLVCLAACASDQPKPAAGPKETFVTNITKDGAKQFSYSFTMDVPAGGRSSRGGGMHGGGRGGGMGGGPGMHHGNASSSGSDSDATSDSMKEKVRDKLDSKLSATGYCREGHDETDSQFERGRSQIWGICKEKATDADRKSFPNQ